jgi:nitrite reductase/ring-hydroxylating ferredoxin subunit
VFQHAADLDDLQEGQQARVRVKGRELLLVRWGEEVFATRSVCPHQHASLYGGMVRSRLVQGPQVGDVALSHEEPEVTCPWHAWSFSLRTGVCVLDPHLRIRRYEVKLEDGAVLVDI